MKSKMIVMKFASVAMALSLIGLAGDGHADDKNVSSRSRKNALSSSDVSPDLHMAQLEKAGIRPQSRMPMITDPAQLPAGVRTMLERKAQDGRTSAAYGSEGLFPFTTKRALTSTKNNLPTASYYRKDTARGVGKLWMRFGSDWYVCTGSIIDKGLVVTAAHCVHNFGQGAEGWADEVLFVPMQNGNSKPYGTWKGEEWWVPAVYYDGTDSCEVESPGVVCENDLAVVVIKKKPTNRYVGKAVFPALGDSVGGKYNHQAGNYSYVDISALTEGKTLLAAQISQFGYPASLDDGTRMIRTDSLGLQDTFSNVVIGSDQTGGSSGGPWFVNYGRDYVSEESAPADPQMAVMAVTSWGYDDGSMIKIQGASRFGTNSIYTDKSNIDSLHEDVCAEYPTHCY
ncbi:trypsin-like serine peptidase [Candidatus Electronema sp. JC]|uniref:trypsin-like serine peptidase n=1 Tax=Candidatus Electronema sp. JC TaxID=3401570 RepID=UPI003B42E3B0